MRIQALILVFPFAIFLAETTSFVPGMKDACAIVSQESSCCMMNAAGDEEQCQEKGEDDKNSSGNECTDNPDCTTCPVCYTFIFQPQYGWPAVRFLFKKSYGLLKAGYISSYTPDVWKPPNGFTYYS